MTNISTIPSIPPILVSESLRGLALFGKGMKISLEDTPRSPPSTSLRTGYGKATLLNLLGIQAARGNYVFLAKLAKLNLWQE